MTRYVVDPGATGVKWLVWKVYQLYERMIESNSSTARSPNLLRMRLSALLFLTLSLLFPLGGCASKTEVADMLDSTVQVTVRVEGDNQVSGDHVSGGGRGSGVVYEKASKHGGPVHSRILTAHHVLGEYKVGDVIQTFYGPVKITAVKVEILTHHGQTCPAEVVVNDGDLAFDDAAIIEASCDAGRPARIASDLPPEGSRVFVSGHPNGIEIAIVTEGYTSSPYGDWVVISAPAAHGNSGGPVFYNGEVVGLLIRGMDDYPMFSIMESVGHLQDKIDEAPPMNPGWIHRLLQRLRHA